MVYSEYLAPMIYEFSIVIIVLFVIIQIIKKYRIKKTLILKSMLFFTLSLTLAVFFAAFSRLLRYTNLWEISPGIYIELLAVTMVFIAISNIFMMDFGFQVFQTKDQEKRNKTYTVIYAFFNLAFSVYTLITGLFTVDLTEIIWALLVPLSLVSYFQVSYLSFRLSRNIDNPKDRRAIRMIGISPIAMLFVFISFFIDRIMGGNFTVFYYIGWVFALFTVLFLSTSILRPKWFESL